MPKRGQFTLGSVRSASPCDSCVQGHLRCTRETDGIAAELVECRIASEALRRNEPRSFDPKVLQSGCGVDFLSWSGEFYENCPQICQSTVPANFSREYVSLVSPGFQPPPKKIHSCPGFTPQIFNFRFFEPNITFLSFVFFFWGGGGEAKKNHPPKKQSFSIPTKPLNFLLAL